VITPYSDKIYPNMTVGGKISDTLDIGLGCVNTFECTLKTPIGPYLLPSPFPGGNEVPPMPELKSAPPGTDLLRRPPGAGRRDGRPADRQEIPGGPSRVGPVTGSRCRTSRPSRRTAPPLRATTTPSASKCARPATAWCSTRWRAMGSNFTVAGRLLTGTCRQGHADPRVVQGRRLSAT
jgi:hypothetical protein